MGLLATIVTVYFYIIFTAAFSTVVLILSGYGWGEFPHKYLKLVLLLQSYFTEDGVVLGSIERTKTGTRRWLFGKSKLSTPDEILDESMDEMLLDDKTRSNFDDGVSSGSDFEQVGSSAPNTSTDDAVSDGLAGITSAGVRNTAALGWHLELLRDGIESVIQDEISDIFAQSSAYRNAEPRSLRDLFFHYSRKRKRHHRRLQVKRQQALDQRILLQNAAVSAKTGTMLELSSSSSEKLADNATGNSSPSADSRLLYGGSHNFSLSADDEEEPPLRFRPFLRSCLLLIVSRVFRVGFLCPVRMTIFLSSFVYLLVVCLSACFIDYSLQTKTWIAIIYCRLFSAATGLIARYHHRENRPKRPGVAVANHLSPNDIQIIFSDVDKNGDYLYILTGQKHHGIIWTIERLVERMCPSIWLERSNAEDRKRFTQEVLDMARTTGPILIFPEGYCTNNQKVLQFRRAVFDEGIIIYPIAIRQDARFGDSYWSEKHFSTYLLRILTAWAIVYDVYYLPSRTRRPNETSTNFALSVQSMIADKIGLECANFDASLFYKQNERLKYRKLWNAEFAKRIQAVFVKKISSTTSNGVESVDDTEVLSDAHCKLVVAALRTRTKSASVGCTVLEPSKIFKRCTPLYGALSSNVLMRRQYNSLQVLKRQFSADADDNSDNAQLRG